MPSPRHNPKLVTGANQRRVASQGSRVFNRGIDARAVREAVMAYQTLCKQRYLGEGEATPFMADGMVEIDLAS
jgi:hypothetical protein